jgi:hypothetical protein
VILIILVSEHYVAHDEIDLLIVHHTNNRQIGETENYVKHCVHTCVLSLWD